MDLRPVGVRWSRDIPDHERVSRLSGEGELPGIVCQHLGEDILGRGLLARSLQLRYRLVRYGPRVRIRETDERALCRGLSQEVRDMTREPVDRDIAGLGVVPLGREAE